MGEGRLVTMVMVVVLVSILVTGLQTEPLESVDIFRHPSSYHLTMLKRSVDKIKRSWVNTPKSHVFKRSTDSQADDLILNSLSSYCTNFQSDPKIAKHFQQVADSQPLRKRDITGYKRFRQGGKTYGMEQEVFPIKVWAQREKDKVWVIFEIAHSETAVISRIDPFNFQKVVLETPEEAVCRKIVSKARFNIDVPREECKDENRELKDVRETFEMTSAENNHFTVIAHVDLCKYDQQRYYASGSRENPMRHQYVSFPTFQIIPDSGDFVLIENGKDLTIDLKVNYSFRNSFSINLVMWDWTTEKTLHSSARLVLDEYRIPRIQVEKVNYDNDDIFTVDFLSETTGPPITVSLRITFTEASGNRSGKLYFSYKDGYSESYPYQSLVVPRAGLERTVEIKLPDRPQVFPDGFTYLSPQKRFMCDENGDKILKDGLRVGKNCTVRCQAFGQNIATVYVTKMEPIKRPIRSAAYVLQDKALAILDVGPSSGDVEGDYRCVAVDRQGQITTQDLKLYTHLFTQMDAFEIERRDLETAHIVCSARGAKDLKICFVSSINGNNETVLDNYERNTTRHGDMTTVKMDIPWANLKFPINRLTCFAKGERGEDNIEKYLSSYKGSIYGVLPIVERHDFHSRRNKNGTVSMTCVASGARPMDLEMYLTDHTDPLQLDPEIPVIKTTETTNDTVSMTYTIPTGYLSGAYLLMACNATNEFSSKTQHFFVGGHFY